MDRCMRYAQNAAASDKKYLHISLAYSPDDMLFINRIIEPQFSGVLV